MAPVTICATCHHTLLGHPPACSSCGHDPRLKARYHLRRLLAKGANATTWEAEALNEQGQIQDLLCIKEMRWAHVLSHDEVARFEREGQLLKALNHEAIPRVLEVFTAGQGRNQAQYLVQELIRGKTLEQRRKVYGHTQEELLELTYELASVLAYLHERHPPLMHRDVKPSNIMRRDDGKMILIDFGAARLANATLSQPISTVGTFGYMAPEQIRGESEPKSDIYGLGVTLAVLATGLEPKHLVNAQNQLLPGPLHRLSQPFVQLLTRMCEPSLEKRLTATKVLHEIQLLWHEWPRSVANSGLEARPQLSAAFVPKRAHPAAALTSSEQAPPTAANGSSESAPFIKKTTHASATPGGAHGVSHTSRVPENAQPYAKSEPSAPQAPRSTYEHVSSQVRFPTADSSSERVVPPAARSTYEHVSSQVRLPAVESSSERAVPQVARSTYEHVSSQVRLPALESSPERAVPQVARSTYEHVSSQVRLPAVESSPERSPSEMSRPSNTDGRVRAELTPPKTQAPPKAREPLPAEAGSKPTSPELRPTAQALAEKKHNTPTHQLPFGWETELAGPPVSSSERRETGAETELMSEAPKRAVKPVSSLSAFVHKLDRLATVLIILVMIVVGLVALFAKRPSAQVDLEARPALLLPTPEPTPTPTPEVPLGLAGNSWSIPEMQQSPEWTRCFDGDSASCQVLSAALHRAKQFRMGEGLYWEGLQGSFDAGCRNRTLSVCLMQAEAYWHGHWPMGQSHTRALEYYRQACELEHTESCLTYGKAMLEGKVVAADIAEAQRVLSPICQESTHDYLCRRLAHSYEKTAPEKGLALLTPMCAAQDKLACDTIERQLKNEGALSTDGSTRLEQLKQLCGYGVCKACDLGQQMLRKGLMGLLQDHTGASALDREACARGCADACVRRQNQRW